MATYAVMLAGGSGSRMGHAENKVLITIAEKPALIHAILPFVQLCKGIVLVIREADKEKVELLLQAYPEVEKSIVSVVIGGQERQHSVENGIAVLPSDCDIVLIHDGARALVTQEVVSRVIESVQKRGSGIASIPVTDTIKLVTTEKKITATLQRENLYAMQTPQGFYLSALKDAYRKVACDGVRCTDDAAVMEYAGNAVYVVEGSSENIKLTTPVDLIVAETILQNRKEER